MFCCPNFAEMTLLEAMEEKKTKLLFNGRNRGEEDEVNYCWTGEELGTVVSKRYG